MTIDLNRCYLAKDDLVTRLIEEELVIVPLSSGVGDLDGEMFSLNQTGGLVWEKLDGVTSLDLVIKKISEEFDAPHDQIKKDVVLLMGKLMDKGLIVEK